MNREFVDTNILVYAQDSSAGQKYTRSSELLHRLVAEGSGALSTQVLIEYYSTAIRKLKVTSGEAAESMEVFAGWTVHQPNHSFVMRAIKLHQRHKTSWWDALILTSALDLDCSVLWTEDLSHNQRFGSLTVKNPFR